MIRKFDELTYYSKLLSKLQHKKYEFYVISRIIHLLNDTEIQFTTQQVVRKTDGKRYIIDLYFPQFKLAVEVDENYHDSQIETDKLREREVIAYTEAEIVRICCNHQASLKTVHSDIDNLVEKIRQLKLETKDFVPYSYSDEFSVEKWLKLGTISTTSDAKFLTHTDVLKLFGKDFTKHQRAISPLKKGTSHLDDSIQVWFPKLYKNGEWNNSLSVDGTNIRQTRVDNTKIEVRDIAKYSIVFAHQKDVLGDTYYSFKGLFECIKYTEDEIVYKRIDTEIKFSDYHN
jgi:hypothetical protein